jgi:hypothetical protein
MSRHSADSGALKLLACLFAGFALFPIGVALYATFAGVAAADWLRTDAIILESTWKVRDGQNTWKTPVVRYRYRVQGIEYAGDRIQFGPVVAVEKRVKALPEGSTHAVYYDPADPSRASLRVGVAWSTLGVYLAAGGFSVAIAAYLLAQAGKRA